MHCGPVCAMCSTAHGEPSEGGRGGQVEASATLASEAVPASGEAWLAAQPQTTRRGSVPPITMSRRRRERGASMGGRGFGHPADITEARRTVEMSERWGVADRWSCTRTRLQRPGQWRRGSARRAAIRASGPQPLALWHGRPRHELAVGGNTQNDCDGAKHQEEGRCQEQGYGRFAIHQAGLQDVGERRNRVLTATPSRTRGSRALS